MNRIYKKLLSSALLTLAFSVTVLAQTPAPFAPGESLIYEAKFNKFKLVIPAADLVLSVDKGGGDDLLFSAEAKSKGTLLKVARFSFLQKVESTVDDEAFRVIKTVKHDVQKERIRNSEALFDYGDKRVTYTESDPNSPMKAPRRIASDLEGTTHDLISGVYSLRMLPLAVGKKFELRISDSGLVYTVPVRVTAREMQKTEIGNVMCFRVEPEVFGNGRMIESKGSMIIWITDDVRRIPVRSQVNAPVGKIEIKIRSISNTAPTVQTATK
jgi:hypothetical protein